MSRIDQCMDERIHSNQVDVTPELPAQAVREAIVNADVHREYTSTGSVQVMLFKDRLEVWNPGKLPLGMTIDKLRNLHSSRPVNPTLANPVYLTGYIEQMGTGTTDIIEQCEKVGLRTPEFHQDEDFLTIIWRPEIKNEEKAIKFDAEGVPQDVPQAVSQGVPQTIVTLIKNNPKITREDIALQLNLSVKTIGRYIAKMPNIKYIGSGYSGYWEIEE